MNRRAFLLAGLAGLLSRPARAATSTPQSAIALATMDSAQLSDAERPFVRYIWVRSGDPKDVKAVSLGVNWLSYRLPRLLDVIGGGKMPTLVRVYLPDHAKDKDLGRWIEAWEELQYDPSFNLLYTYDTLNLFLNSGADKPEWFIKTSPTLKQIVYRRGGKETWSSVVAVPWVDQAGLEVGLGTLAPVVECDYFLNRALSSQKSLDGKGFVWDTLYRGLYYKFIGVRTAKEAGKKKGTDLDLLMQDLGIIDDADGPVNFQQKLDSLDSEQRVAMTKSKVTGKPRAVFILPTLKTSRERNVVFITHDPKDESIDTLDNVFKNLNAYQGDAFEVIWNGNNGAQKYALYNREGALQFEVPPNVANDSTILAPYTQRLNTYGCITCHGPQDGWQPLPNHAVDLLPRLLGDRSLSKASIEQIREKYAGNADALLMDLRRGTMAAAMRMAGPWEGENQTQAYQLGALQLDKIRKRFWYTDVNIKGVLAELGMDNAVIGPDGPFEDSNIVLLLKGHSLTRAQVDQVKGFIAIRAKEAK